MRVAATARACATQPAFCVESALTAALRATLVLDFSTEYVRLARSSGIGAAPNRYRRSMRASKFLGAGIDPAREKSPPCRPVTRLRYAAGVRVLSLR
jgi:hypothetical protein